MESISVTPIVIQATSLPIETKPVTTKMLSTRPVKNPYFWLLRIVDNSWPFIAYFRSLNFQIGKAESQSNFIVLFYLDIFQVLF